METRRAWLVLALGDEREYKGNEGYADELDSVYRYDSFVPNHKQIAQGDLLVLRDGKEVLGTAAVSEIVSQKGSKTLKRCPTCRIATIKERKFKKPQFNCKAGHEFDSPILDERKCVHFAIHFNGTFRRLKKAVPVAQVRSACPRYNGQLAMQVLSLELLSGDAKRLIQGAAAFSGPVDTGLVAADASDERYVPDKRDEREVIHRQIKERRGQKAFRQKLRSRYGDTCPITGCKLVDLLEACHINPHRGDKDNHPSNGLLLRADIHTLFDLDLIGIDPVSIRVHTRSSLKGSEYEQLEGRRLACDPKLLSADALESRWVAFEQKRSRARE